LTALVPQVVALDPLSDDAAAGIVVPFHNAAFRELFPDREDAGFGEFKARFAAPEMETRFFGAIDGDGGLAGLCVVRLWVDGTNERTSPLRADPGATRSKAHRHRDPPARAGHRGGGGEGPLDGDDGHV